MSNVVKNVASISVKTIAGTAKEMRKLVETKPGEKIFVGRIGGQANEKFAGESKHGEFIGFKGLFFAINKDGERYASEVVFLPKNLSDKICEMFSEGVLEVTIPPADIYVVESEKNAAGYAYMCKFTMDEASVKKAETIANTVFSLKLPSSRMIEAPKAAKK